MAAETRLSITRSLDFSFFFQRKLFELFEIFPYLYNLCLCVRATRHFSRFWLCVTLWTVACQAPPSMGFSRQEYQVAIAAAAAAKSCQSCLTLCDPTDGSSPGSSVPGILQARTLEWVRKTSTFALLTMPKPLTLWITTNCGKFWKRWEYETTWPASWEISMLVKKQLHMEQQTGSKSGKEYVKAVYCYPAYLTYMQSTSRETLGWWSSSWNQDCWEKYQ